MSVDPTDDRPIAPVVPLKRGARAQPLPAAPPPLPKDRELSERHAANLAASGITPETAKRAQLYTEGDGRLIAALLRWRSWPRSNGSALVFPFFLPGADQPFAYRVRPTYPRVEVKRNGKRREVKYEQAPGSDVMAYFPPRSRESGAYADITRPVVWCEGEKKSLALDQLGLTVIGLTGVDVWRDTSAARDGDGERLHPLITDHVRIAGRDHVICFDADARDNPNVMRAAQQLTGVLLAAGARSVGFVCPPSKTHKGIDDFLFAFGADVTLALIAKPEPIEPLDPKQPLQLVHKLRPLADAPISKSLRMPEGYEVQKDGSLWRIGDAKKGDIKLAASPILITRYLDDIYTHESRVDICYQRDHTWIQTCVGRKTLADARTLVTELAGFGAPVTSNSAPKLVDWLEDLAAVNAGRIERLACVSRTGWHDIDGRRVFVLHEPVYADDAGGQPIALDTRGDRKRMFAALEPRGTFDAHLSALRRAWAAERTCAITMCAALAATLLEVLDAPNFAVHLVGDSSRGKTSMLKIAASIFGYPNADAWIASWNVTAVGAEMRASTFNGLPQVYDEAGVTDPQAIEKMVYMLINGGGRARAQRDLTMRETPSWRATVISTGERELADESAATGAQIRVIQLPVVGFGRLTGAEVDELRELAAANAGSFGRAWIEMLLAIDDWAPWRELYRDTVRGLRAGTTDTLQGRVASYFGVLVVAEMLAAKLGLGAEDGATMVAAFRDTTQREVVQSLADRALELVNDWTLAEADAFPELVPSLTGHDEAPRRGAPNRVRHGFRKGSGVLLIPSAFRAFCARNHLSAREVLRAWRERGWLLHAPDRLDKTVRVGDGFRRFYHLDTHEPTE